MFTWSVFSATHVQASVGRNVSLCLSPSADVVQPQVDSLVATVIHDLCTQREDQCVLVYGSKVSHKSLVFNTVVSSLVSATLRIPQDNHSSLRLLEGSKLLSLLTDSGGDTECVIATAMCVESTTTELCGGHFSCLLLNTSVLNKLQVPIDWIHVM